MQRWSIRQIVPLTFWELGFHNALSSPTPHLLPDNAPKSGCHGRQISCRSVGNTLQDVRVQLSLVLCSHVDILCQSDQAQRVLLIVWTRQPPHLALQQHIICIKFAASGSNLLNLQHIAKLIHNALLLKEGCPSPHRLTHTTSSPLNP
jgi:hypothetical protein